MLGDDVVIFHPLVAKHYQDIMKTLGVGINLSKSLVSSDSFEFAKRFICKEVDVSPVSFKEMDVSSSSLEACVLLFQKFSSRGVNLAQFAKYRGAGYRVLGSLNRDLKHLSRHWRMLVAFLSQPGLSAISVTR